MNDWINKLDKDQLENASLIADEAKKAGISPKLAVAMAFRESNLYHNKGEKITTSPKGAVGIMQIMPNTATELNIDSSDKEQNIRGGVNYLKQMLEKFDNDPMLASAAYNHGANGSFFLGGELPQETKDYIRFIQDHGGFEENKASAVVESGAMQSTPATGYGGVSRGLIEAAGAGAGAVSAGTGVAIKGAIKSAGDAAGEAMAKRLIEEGRASSAGAVPEIASAVQNIVKPIEVGTSDAGRLVKGQTGTMPYNYAKAAGLTDIEAARALDMTKQEGGAHDLSTKRRIALNQIKQNFPGERFVENPRFGGIMTPTQGGGGGPRQSFVIRPSVAPSPEVPQGIAGGEERLPTRQPISTSPNKTEQTSQILSKLAAKYPSLISGFRRILSGGLGGFGGAAGGMEALDRYQRGDMPAAALAGTGALASLGMIPAATAAFAAPVAISAGLGLGGYDLVNAILENSRRGEEYVKENPPTEKELEAARRAYHGQR